MKAHYERIGIRRVLIARGSDGGPRYHVRAPETIKGGYQRVSLSLHGHSKHYLMHVLVAEAFIGPRPAGHEVNHQDLDPTNNRAFNLEYTTPSGNVRHSFAQGKRCPARGEGHGQAKLTHDQARALLDRWRVGGITRRKLAHDFGVNPSTSGRIIAGKLWAHLGSRTLE